MAISSIVESDFKKLIAQNFTPSEEIRTPERLFGREKNMRMIDRAMNSAGRQIFIYGDRGVGKTSLAVTAAYVHTASASLSTYLAEKIRRLRQLCSRSAIKQSTSKIELSGQRLVGHLISMFQRLAASA